MSGVIFMAESRKFDIVVVTDPRFSGGSATALLADIYAFRQMGATVGVFLVFSDFFLGAPDTPHPEVTALGDLDGVSMIENGADVAASLVFFHHPLTFFHQITQRFSIKADRAVLVAHHPAFRGDGSLEYNPLTVNRRINALFGLRPWWAPVSGLVRQQLRSFAPLLRLTSDDWVNLFDPSDWRPTRPAFEGDSRVIGRHSRADPLKWPDTAALITQSLDVGTDWKVRVMGWPLDQLSFDVPAAANWDILAFNQEPVQDFVNSLDVFSYHFSSLWVEAFGRTILEAMLLERPCLLDPRLEGTFGKLATYCQPADVGQAVEKLSENVTDARQKARDARVAVIKIYSADAVADRVARLRTDSGTVSRQDQKTAGAMTTLRKVIGLARRQRG